MKMLLLYSQMDLPETMLTKELTSLGFDFHVLCDTTGGYYHLLEETSIKVEHFVFKSRVDFSSIKYLKKLIQENNYEIVHAFTSRALANVLLATIGQTNPPKIIAYRGAIGHVSRFDPTTWLTYRNKKIAAINCVSHAVHSYLKACGISTTKLVTLYKGHRLEWYKPKTRQELTNLGIPEDAFVVACVSNMRRIKGIDVLLKAAIKLSGKYKNIHYLLLGEVRNKELKELAQDSRIKSNVHMPGWREDAATIAGAADIFVMPSRDREGLPKGVIEAMAQGLPPIVTNIGGMPELVRNLKEGIVIPPDNVTLLAEAIASLYNSPELRAQYSKASLEKIKNDFSLVQSVNEMATLYRQVGGNSNWLELKKSPDLRKQLKTA